MLLLFAEYLKFAQCDANITKDEAKCGGVFKRVLQISQEQPAPPTVLPSQETRFEHYFSLKEKENVPTLLIGLDCIYSIHATIS